MKQTRPSQLLSHHASCLIGSDSTRIELISDLEKDHSISAQANPDFFDKRYETFTIDDAREIKSLHSTRPMNSGGKKIFVLTMNGATIEAQNALLKLLEEPNDDSHFFIIIPSTHLLVPTIKSRVTIVGRQAQVDTSLGSEEARTFLKLSVPKRLEMIKVLVDDIAKEKKTKQDAIDFLDQVQVSMYSKKDLKGSLESLEAIETARKYIHDRAPSMKMLLEYVALNI